jgi:AcrR family transcriptional regulator
MNDRSAPSSRDREGTERRILAAARLVLAQDGSAGFGINAVARAAGCDKQLIYRYFGGINGLIDALGADLAEGWADRLGKPDATAQSYGDVMRDLVPRVVAALRSEPLMQKIALWELSDGSSQVRQLASARSRAMSAFVQEARGDLSPPGSVDAPVVNALLLGGIHQLVLAAQASRTYTDLSLATEEDWTRIEKGLTTMIDRIYAV